MLLRCAICVEIFEGWNALQHHICHAHLDYMPYFCNRCPRAAGFTTLSAVTEHQRSAHHINMQHIPIFGLHDPRKEELLLSILHLSKIIEQQPAPLLPRIPADEEGVFNSLSAQFGDADFNHEANSNSGELDGVPASAMMNGHLDQNESAAMEMVSRTGLILSRYNNNTNNTTRQKLIRIRRPYRHRLMDPNGNRGRRHPVWKHFIPQAGGRDMACNACGIIIAKGITSNMTKHLNRRHNAIYKQIILEWNSMNQCPSTSSAGAADHQPADSSSPAISMKQE